MQENSSKTSTSALLTTQKHLIVWITTKCGKSLKKWEYQINLPASWEVCIQVKKQQLELDKKQDWFQIGKGVRQGSILSPGLFNLHAEHIMQNARLHEAQAGIKIVWRNINNLRYADDIALMEKVKKNKRASFFSFIFISWRLITLQYCSGFCHTLTWISHGFIYIPHPDPP